jgi:hypothetical protein
MYDNDQIWSSSSVRMVKSRCHVSFKRTSASRKHRLNPSLQTTVSRKHVPTATNQGCIFPNLQNSIPNPKPLPRSQVAAATSDGRASPAENWKGTPPRYTDDILRDVGKGVVIAALDMKGANPWSRLPNCHQKDLEEMRDWLKSRLISTEPYR